MRNILIAGLIALMVGLTSCHSGTSGTLTGRVVDGFGNPLGGSAVMITLTGNPAVHSPDRWGNFIIHAPTGDYTMTISFSNPDAGFSYLMTETVHISNGSRALGTFTMLNVQNMEAWEYYQDGEYLDAIARFSEQAERARTGQVWLTYYRYMEGEPEENTLLTQGVLSAENGLGWCFARGLHQLDEGKIHYEASLARGYNNYDAYVGLAGIALSEGNGAEALGYLDTVIDELGYYDSSQIHDNITEVDLIAAKALAQFLLGQDGYSDDTVDSIRDRLAGEANAGSVDLVNMLDMF